MSRREWGLLACVLVVLASPVSAQYGMRGGSQGGGGSPPDTTWPNDPYNNGVSGWVLFTDDSLNSATGTTDGHWSTGCGAGGCTTGGGSSFTVHDTTTGPRSPPHTWQWFYKQSDGGVCGSTSAVPSATMPSAPKKVYFGMWVWYDPNFSYPAHPETHAITVFQATGSGGPVLDLGDATEVANQFGAMSTDNHNSTVNITKGTWTKVEYLIQWSDSSFQLWLNGVKGIDDHHVAQWDASGAGAVHLSNDWGGCGSPPLSPVNDSYLRWDHLHVTYHP